MRSAKSFNPQVFLEIVSCLVFGGLMVYLAATDKYLTYVTPRMKPYIIFAAVVMGIFAAAGLGRLTRPQHVARTAHCFVLAIPVLLLLLPHSAISTSEIKGGYVGGSVLGKLTSPPASSGSQNSIPTTSPASDESIFFPTSPEAAGTTNPPATTAAPAEGTDASTDAPTGAPQSTTTETTQAADIGWDGGVSLSGRDTVNKHITIGNDEFYPWLVEIVTGMDNYVGYTVSMTGYVYRDPLYYAQDEFVPARLAMTCCSADLSPIGLLCKYDRASELASDSWVSVEGVIYKGQYEGQDEVQIHVTSVSPAEEVEGYIYPY